MNKKLVALVVIAIIIIAGVAIYYATLPPPAPPPEEKPPSPTPVTLELWTSFAGEIPQEEFFDYFQKKISEKYPYITLKVTHYTGKDYLPKLTSAMAAGTPPDIFVSYGGGQLKALVDEGQVEDLTMLLSEPWAKELIPEGAKASHTFSGKTYALPYELNTAWLMINKKLFREAGVEIPAGVWTWDEFMQAVQKFRKKGIYPLTISGNAPRHMVYHLDYLIERIAGQEKFIKTLNREPGYSFTDAQFVEAFKKFRELVEADAFYPGAKGYGYMDAVASFGRGEAAMLCIYTWVVAPLLKDFPDLELDIINYPVVPGGAGGPDIAGYTLGLAVAKGSKNKEAAFNVLRLFAQKDIMLEYARITGNPIALNIEIPKGTLNPVSEKAYNLAKGATTFVYRKGTYMPPELGSKYEEVVSKVFYGEMTPEQAAAELENKAKELKELGKLPM